MIYSFLVLDIDECLVPDICSKKNEQCVNSAGGFSCECVDGHTRQDGVCQPKPKGGYDCHLQNTK